MIGLLSGSSDLERHFNVKLMISMQIYLCKAAAEMGRTGQQMMCPVSLSYCGRRDEQSDNSDKCEHFTTNILPSAAQTIIKFKSKSLTAVSLLAEQNFEFDLSLLDAFKHLHLGTEKCRNPYLIPKQMLLSGQYTSFLLLLQ